MAYTAPPLRWDHEAIVGDTYQPAEVQLVDAAGVAYSLAGVTGVAQVRLSLGGLTILTPTVTVTDAPNGRFTWSSSAGATGGLTPGAYPYGIRLTWGDGTVRTVLLGTVTFLPARL